MASSATVTITLVPHGWTVDVAAGDTVLAAFERAGVEIPNSCRNGTCRTCLCRLAAGSVRYTVEWPGLSPDEKRDGYVLPCVAVPLGPVTVEQPVARRVEWAHD